MTPRLGGPLVQIACPHYSNLCSHTAPVAVSWSRHVATVSRITSRSVETLKSEAN